MADWKRDVVTMREIEGIWSIRGPHEKELDDIAQDKLPIFREVSSKRVRLKQVASSIVGELADYTSNEEWVLVKPLFPGARVYLSYEFFGDEFGAGEEDQDKTILKERMRQVAQTLKQKKGKSLDDDEYNVKPPTHLPFKAERENDNKSGALEHKAHIQGSPGT